MASILIIEDNPACAELARVVCEALGHPTDVAATPEQALARVACGHYDLALAAWSFGAGLVADLRAREPGLRVVTTTAQPVAFARAAFAGTAAVEVLAKPFVVTTLRQRLDAALAG